MRRTILLLTSGTLIAALITGIFSVYVFHDVDRDQIGHLNQAFAGLVVESAVFALVIGAATGVFTAAGRYFLRLKGHPSRPALGLVLGVGVSIFQYPWDLLARKLVPYRSDLALASYMSIVIVLCTAVLLRDGLKGKKLDSL